jgi:hypothetical protein
MGSSDGFVASKVKIVDHGDDALRFNIVILGDGYQASELGKYHTDVDNFVNTFRATPPYPDLWCALNIYRVDIVSTDSGADDPATCGDKSTGSGATPKTFLDATFCGDGNVRRLLTCNNSLALSTAQSVVAHPSMTMVIVNTSEYGGSGGSVATFSTHTDAAQIGIHEMGHTAYGFADEYEYRQGCDSGETGHDTDPGPEPFNANITLDTNPTTIKWKSLLTKAADGLPTTQNADCTKCDPQGNPKAASYVGAYEGAGYFHCGCFRGQFDCKMRKLANDFCAVCQQAIRDTLNPHLPDATPLLETPSIAFANIPEGVGGVGVTTFRAIVFELDACMAATLNLHVTAGPTPPFTTPLGTTAQLVTVSGGGIAQARIWIGYTSTHANDVSSGSVTIHCDETGQDFVVPITANTVARPKTAIAMVLDHSASMSEDAGGGTAKVDKLREAANMFVTAMQDGDGLSLTRFDDTSQILMGVENVGQPLVGTGRVDAQSHLGTDINPAGATSIGAGVVNGKATLDTAVAAGTPHYDNTAMLVLTDGVENTAPMLIDVRSSITANTFAIGLGKPENISVAALSALTQAHDGYLLVTGALTPDQSARLNKYFLQILAGATNANIVLDPHGELAATEQRIPFRVTESDIGLDVFLLSPVPVLVDFQLQTPDGTLITPATAGNIKFTLSSKLSYYRLALPALPQDESGSHAGTWYAVLKLARGRLSLEATGASASANGGVLPYDIVVHTYSNLNFRAYVSQSSFEPGASAALTASLREYDVPVDGRASVWAEVTRPDGSAFTLAMPQVDPGQFTGTFTCGLSGLYPVRVRAVGTTFYGSAFQREQTLSVAVYAGGGNPNGTGGPTDNGASDGHPGTGTGTGAPRDPFWCELVQCLLRDGVLSPRLVEELKSRGFDLVRLLQCLGRQCGGKRASGALSAAAVQRIAEAVARELDSP